MKDAEMFIYRNLDAKKLYSFLKPSLRLIGKWLRRSYSLQTLILRCLSTVRPMIISQCIAYDLLDDLYRRQRKRLNPRVTSSWLATLVAMPI
jgi:hypothetical protein